MPVPHLQEKVCKDGETNAARKGGEPAVDDGSYACIGMYRDDTPNLN